MNERELKIFNKGVEVGMKLEKEFAQTMHLIVSDHAKTILKKKKKSKGGAWTEEEDNIIRNNSDMKSSELIQLLPGRTVIALLTRRSNLGVTKSKKVEDNLAKLGQ